MPPKKLAAPANEPSEDVRVAPAVATVEEGSRRVVVVLLGLKREIRVELRDPAARHDPHAAERAVDLLADLLGSTPTDDPATLARTEGKMSLTIQRREVE